MHELSLAEDVLQLIEDAAEQQGFSRVKTVWLEIGQLSAVEQDAMRFCFDDVMRDTIAHGARLEIIDTPGAGKCRQCACTMPLASLYELCPACGSPHIDVTAGREMRVKELEVE